MNKKGVTNFQNDLTVTGKRKVGKVMHIYAKSESTGKEYTVYRFAYDQYQDDIVIGTPVNIIEGDVVGY